MSEELPYKIDKAYRIRLMNVMIDAHDALLVDLNDVREDMVEQAKDVFNAVNKTSRSLEANNHDPMDIAFALMQQSLAMMATSTDERKCHYFAKAMKKEAEEFDEMVSGLFN